MGLLDSVIGALGSSGGGGGGGNAALIQAILGMLSQPGGAGQAEGGLGGLGALVEKFQQGGLGDVMNSWISTGENQPITPEQLGGVLGQDTLAQMSGQLGLEQGDLLGQLSRMLPQVVDSLTPQGQLPSGGGLGDLGPLAGMLGGLLKR